MKYNITSDGVIPHLLQQRFPECIFGKAKAARNISIRHANVRAILIPFRRVACALLCSDLIVKVAVIWAADEHTLNLMD